MYIVSIPGDAGFAEVPERRFQFVEYIRFRPEMAEVVIAFLGFFLHDAFHIGAVIAMESVALDEGGRDTLTPENLLKHALHGGRAGTG
jgi:hypothetical protein